MKAMEVNTKTTEKNKNTLKMYTELWDKIKDLISSITNNSGDYDEKYMKIKFNSDDNLPLNKILKLHHLVIIVRFVFLRRQEVLAAGFLR